MKQLLCYNHVFYLYINIHVVYKETTPGYGPDERTEVRHTQGTVVVVICKI